AAASLLDRLAVLVEDQEAGLALGRETQLEADPLGLVATLQDRLTVRGDGDPHAGLPLGVERPPHRRVPICQAQDEARRLSLVEELQARDPVRVDDQGDPALVPPVEIQDEATVRRYGHRQSALLVAVEQAELRPTALGHTQVEPDRAPLVEEIQV